MVKLSLLINYSCKVDWHQSKNQLMLVELLPNFKLVCYQLIISSSYVLQKSLINQH